MKKPVFCICENKGTDQLRGNHAADQRLCFPYIDIVQFVYRQRPKFKASSHLLWLYSLVGVRPGPNTPTTGFLMTRLNFEYTANLFVCLICCCMSTVNSKARVFLFFVLPIFYATS